MPPRIPHAGFDPHAIRSGQEMIPRRHRMLVKQIIPIT